MLKKAVTQDKATEHLISEQQLVVNIWTAWNWL